MDAKHFRDDSGAGSILILVSLMIIAQLGFVFVCCGGLLIQHTQLQRTTDAFALSELQSLDSACATDRNLILESDVHVTRCEMNGTDIRVAVTQPVHLSFISRWLPELTVMSHAQYELENVN